jgi:hypothetical protein
MRYIKCIETIMRFETQICNDIVLKSFNSFDEMFCLVG